MTDQPLTPLPRVAYSEDFNRPSPVRSTGSNRACGCQFGKLKSVHTSLNQRAQSPHIYDLISVAFVAFLLISNIAATKLIAVNVGITTLIFDGGAILFPFTYIFGDVLSEVYGFSKAKRTILIGFVMSILASVIFLLVGAMPPAPGYDQQAAFVAVLGFVPRIVLASLLGYLAGQLLNAWVLVGIKERWGQDHLWARLIGSTLVGEAADTVIFCTVAFYGVITGGQFLNYVLVGYVYKVAVEVIALPLTYPTIAVVKRIESGYQVQEVKPRA